MRKRITPGETLFGAAFLMVLLLTAVWIRAQQDNFNPDDRDISIKILEANSVKDTLYEPPLKLWVEPGTSPIAGAGPDLGLFPDDILADGWAPDGRLERYEPDNLYQKINGAAEQYLSFGFEELSYLTISKGEDLLSLEVYDQGRFENTLGLFAAQRSAGREVITDGDLFYYLTPVGAVGGIGRYYFKLAGNSDTDAITDKSSQLVDSLIFLGSATASVPKGFSLLTAGLEIAFDQLSYKPTDAFQYDFASDFWFGAPGDCDDCRLFIHQADDGNAAGQLFARLLEEQQYEYSLLKQDDREASFEHEYLKTVFSIRYNGSLIFGVDGAPDQATASRLMNRLREVVNNGQT